MNCRETESLLDAYLDSELDLVRSLELERHLEGCAACAQAQRGRQALRTTLAASRLYYEAPARLDSRVRLALRSESPSERRVARRAWRWNWPTVLAPVAATALLLAVVLPLLVQRQPGDVLPEEILAAHVRSLMVEHKTDVASSDQHTVKPWFDGKLDFAPPVFDLAERGFSLVGGRLDYIHGRPVAALVYQRRKHFINLFIWPANDQAATPRTWKALHGYNEIHWTGSGMTFWAVSDLNRAELTDLAQLIKQEQER